MFIVYFCFKTIKAISKYGEKMRSNSRGQKFLTDIELARIMKDENYDVAVIDCRQGYEFNGGHIKGAKHADWRKDGKQKIIKWSSKIKKKPNHNQRLPPLETSPSN